MENKPMDDNEGSPSPGQGRSDQALTEFCDQLKITGWVPPGMFVGEPGVWVTADTEVSFPESGVEVFRTLDGQSFWFDHRNRVISQVLAETVPPAEPFVEVGAGSGVVVDHIRRTTRRPVASIEPLPQGAAAVAHRGVPISFCGDLESLALPDHCLPVIGAFDVVEHLTDPVGFLTECRRVLQANGVLLVTVPAYPRLWSEFDVWNGHVQRFTVKSLEHLLGESGFIVERSTHVFAALVVPAYLTRVLLPRMFGSSKDPGAIERVEEALAPTSRVLDSVLRSIHGLEGALLKRTNLPFGTSILVTARPAS